MGERYDGRWWKALSPDEKDGFLSGYFDCYIWDAKGSDYSSASITQEIQHITEYYNAHPDAEGTPVIELLHKVAGQKPKSAEGERHGAYDGDYWRQSSHPERIAFIRGYVECRKVHLHSVFSKPIENYENAISQWYGVSDSDESQLNAKTRNDKIGDILVRLRDRSAGKRLPKGTKTNHAQAGDTG